jgi:hypothetical protein
MGRVDYYHDLDAPRANSLVVGSSTVVVDDRNRILRIVGIYSDHGHVFAYDDGEVRQEFSTCLACAITGGSLPVSSESTVPWDHGGAMCAGACPAHAGPQDCTHSPGPWLLRVSATAIIPTDVRSHSSTAARFQPSRRHNLRGLRFRFRWSVANGRTARILLRAGISSSDASRLNMPSREASPGSDSASPPSMDSSACCS